MKKYKLILLVIGILVFLMGVVYLALLFSPMGYQVRFVVDVNRGRFERAAKVISNVPDWDYNSNNRTDWIDVNKGLDFYEYLDSLNLCDSLCDSLLLYLAEECRCEALKYWREESDYQTAEPYYLQSLEIKRFVHGEFNLDYATSLNNISALYVDMGEDVKAEQYLLQSLNIKKNILGENHPDVALILENLGTIYIKEGHYKEAQKVLFQATEIQKKSFGFDHPDYARSLNLMGSLLYNIGDYCGAEKYYIDALTIYEKQPRQSFYSFKDLLCNLGLLYCTMGEYDKSESYLIEALDITRDLVGENNLDYSHVLNNLGNLYSEIGDLQNAKKCYQQSCEIVKNIFGERDLRYATDLHNLSTIYAELNDTVNWEECLLRSWEILSERDSNNVAVLINIGDYYKAKGNLPKAETYYLHGLEILKNTKDTQPFYRTSLLLHIGDLYYDQNLQKAETYYLQALEYCKKELGEKHPLYSIILNNIGRFYYRNKVYLMAEPYFTECFNLSKSQYVGSTDYLSERQRALFWNRWSVPFELFIPRLAYKSPTSNNMVLAFNNELFKKGVLLNSSESIKRAVSTSRDTVLIAHWNELTNEKRIILNIQEKDPQSPDLEEHKDKAEQLEKEITKASATYRENQAMWQISWSSVRNHLAPKQVAIEYVVVPLNEDSTMYCALLLRKNSKYPELFPLFNEKDVLPLINIKTANHETPYKAYDYNGNGKILTEKVWGKILPYIKKGETIYFAPSGLLHQLAIEALPYDSTHTMADMYNLVRLSSTREIVLHKDNKRHEKAALYGGIQYNMSGKEFLTESQRYAGTDLLASRGIVDNTNNRGTVAYLKGTKEEVENINQMLKENQLQVQLFTSTTANEESFKALSGKHQNIVHIATHGFYWTDSTAQKSDYFSQRMMTFDQNMPTPPSIDPLNRCGLLFAGANTAYSGHSSELPEGVQDGILTAKEISLLDLRDADLVVLSACETGKGEITGDGVFGLQRAFKQAGAQTLVMSLWKVDDKATQLLMTEFYRNLISKHQSKREAFHNAQNHVRSQYKAPYYWAGFIMLD